MGLSTSASRRVALRTLAASALLLGGALGLLHLVIAAAEATGLNPFRVERLITAREALPHVAAEPLPGVIVFGSSTVELGFDPRHFDGELSRLGVDVRSFNFGFAGLEFRHQRLMARRLREAYDAADARVALALVEFAPALASARRPRVGAEEDEQLRAALASPAELLAALRDDPERGVRMLAIRHLRSGVSAAATTRALTRALTALLDPAPPPADPEVRRALAAREVLWRELVARVPPELAAAGIPHVEAWYPRLQGGHFGESDVSAETMDLLGRYLTSLQHPHSLAEALRLQEESYATRNLSFDEKAFDEFLEVVAELQSVSDEVDVILMPIPLARLQVAPESLERLARIAETIERRTGSRVRDFQRLYDGEESLFVDGTHLAVHSGRLRWSSDLARVYAPLLRRIDGGDERASASDPRPPR